MNMNNSFVNLFEKTKLSLFSNKHFTTLIFYRLLTIGPHKAFKNLHLYSLYTASLNDQDVVALVRVANESSTGMEIWPSMRPRMGLFQDRRKCVKREGERESLSCWWMIRGTYTHWRFNMLSLIINSILITAFYNDSFCYLCYTYFHFVFNFIEIILGFWKESVGHGRVRAVGSVNLLKHWIEGVEQKSGP